MQTTIRQHCNTHHIKIIEHPGGAVRFIGGGVDVAYSEWRYVKQTDLWRDDTASQWQARADTERGGGQ